MSRAEDQHIHHRLTDQERQALEGRARKYTWPYHDVFRTKIVVLAAQGLRNDEMAGRLNARRDVLCGASGSSRNGWPASRNAPAGDARRFPPLVVMAVTALACELPRTLELPFPAYSYPTSPRRLPAGASLHPSPGPPSGVGWMPTPFVLGPTDPGSSAGSHFEVKAGVFLDLYAQFGSNATTDNDFVPSADEKTSIQARCQCHPTLPAAPSRAISLNMSTRGEVRRSTSRPGCAPGKGVPALRGQDRHRAVQPAGGPGDGHRAVRLPPLRALDGGQRLVVSRPGQHRPQEGRFK